MVYVVPNKMTTQDELGTRVINIYIKMFPRNGNHLKEINDI